MSEPSFCVNCRLLHYDGRWACARCGSRLMPVVHPGLRWADMLLTAVICASLLALIRVVFST